MMCETDKVIKKPTAIKDKGFEYFLMNFCPSNRQSMAATIGDIEQATIIFSILNPFLTQA